MKIKILNESQKSIVKQALKTISSRHGEDIFRSESQTQLRSVLEDLLPGDEMMAIRDGLTKVFLNDEYFRLKFALENGNIKREAHRLCHFLNKKMMLDGNFSEEIVGFILALFNIEQWFEENDETKTENAPDFDNTFGESENSHPVSNTSEKHVVAGSLTFNAPLIKGDNGTVHIHMGSPVKSGSQLSSQAYSKRRIKKWLIANKSLMAATGVAATLILAVVAVISLLFGEGLMTNEHGDGSLSYSSEISGSATAQDGSEVVNDAISDEYSLPESNLGNSESIEKQADAAQPQLPESAIISSRPLPLRNELANVGNLVSFGGFQWRVIGNDEQNGRTLLLSNDIIESRPFHELEGETTWENSTIRAYLNTDFFSSFTLEERELIVDTRLINHDNPWIVGEGGNDTYDKVFLLSINEVIMYFGDSGHIGNRSGSTINDRFNEMRIAYFNNERSVWLLRTPGFDNGGVAFISNNGWIQGFGTIGLGADRGIRPALWLNINAL